MVLRALLSALVFILSQHTHALERLELATEPFPPYFSNTLYQHGWMAHLVSEAFRSQNIVVRIHFTLFSLFTTGHKFLFIIFLLIHLLLNALFCLV